MNQDVRAPRPTTSAPQETTANSTSVVPNQTTLTAKPTKRAWYKNRKLWLMSGAGVILLAAIITVTVFLVTKNNEPKQPLSQAAKHYQEQLPGLKKKVDEKPDDASAHKNYAVALYATGDLKSAQKQYEEATKINDKDAITYNNLGNVYRDLGKTDEAVKSYKKALELDPKSLNTYANLANLQLYSQNDAKAAIETYQKGLENLPNNTQLQLLLGIAYEQDGNTEKAKEAYTNILARDADNKAAQANLERLNK